MAIDALDQGQPILPRGKKPPENALAQDVETHHGNAILPVHWVRPTAMAGSRIDAMEVREKPGQSEPIRRYAVPVRRQECKTESSTTMDGMGH